ncbi:hypothetical protein KFE25_000130 [Diacronema lutheri]|uniref:N-acetyltransferase domain-containing protein n=1 Tax=Diacronema lutheri TaxID=2081491 RepID=A0A8J5XHA1_DIALT|nr:hypothetical protein KFE25_000130 [Diacronema lutheri]
MAAGCMLVVVMVSEVTRGPRCGAPHAAAVAVRRVGASELAALYPNDWHDNAALRNGVLSRVAELVATDLLGASSAQASFALQKRIYTDYLRRFALSPAVDRALLVAHDADGLLVGSCCCGIVRATADGQLENEPLVQRDGSAALRPPWPQPWDRADPLTVLRALLAGPAADDARARAGGDFVPRAVLDGLVVRASSRRAGVGRALVAEAEMLARSWGSGALLLRVEAANRGAREFYTQLGYTPPAGCDERVAGRKLVADRFGAKWAPAEDAPLARAL